MPGLILSNQVLNIPNEGILPHMYFEQVHLNQTDSGTEIYFSTYKGYPFLQFRIDAYEILLEGYIYDLELEQIQQQLSVCLHLEGDLQDNLAAWTEKRDGEFILVIHNSTQNKLFLANDVLGRLPLYYHQENGKFLISREISILLDHVHPKYDAKSMASQLLFGFVIGDRTAYEGVEKLPAHSLLTIDLSQNEIQVKTYLEIGSLLIETNEKKKTPLELKEALKAALLRRLHVCGSSGLALSGGKDSRIIAALLKECGVELPSFTYGRTENNSDADIRYAQKLVERLGLHRSHELINLHHVDEEQVSELWKIKRGQNFLAMAYLLPFLKVFRDRGLCQITGDGGDTLFEDIFPLIPLKSEKQLLNYTINQLSIIPLEKVCALTGLSPEQVKEPILVELKRDKNLTFDQRFAAFILKERGMNWSFEGEDRNRYYAWSLAPIYAPDLLRASLQLSVHEKQYGCLFTALLDQLPGKTADIINPNWNLAPNDTKAIKKLFQRQIVKAILPAFILKLRKKKVENYADFRKRFPYVPEELEFNSSNSCLAIAKLSEAGELPLGAYWYLISLPKVS